MTVENATYIAGLDPLRPLLDADISEGDDHLRLTKHVLVETFPGADGGGFAKAITASEDELNRVEGVTSPIQEQLQDLDDSKLGNEGTQVLDGQLTIDDSLVILGTLGHGYGGVNIKRAAKGHAWGALFDLNDTNGTVFISQIGEGAIGDPDTQLNLFGGQAQVNSSIVNGEVNPTDPVYPKSLTTREWIEANFPKLINDALVIPGSVTALRKFHVIDDTTTEGQGFAVYSDSTENDPLMGLFVDGGTNLVYLAQKGAGSKGSPETAVSISEGNLVMSTHVAGKSTDPHSPKSLTTKEWVEDNFLPSGGGGDLNVNGSVTAERKIHVVDDGTSEGQGFAVYSDTTENNPLMGLFVDGGTNTVYLSQRGVGAAGDPETSVGIHGGNLVMSAHTNGGSTNPHSPTSLTTKEWVEASFAPKALMTALETKVNAGVSGTFEDNNGKTITVTDGIITDLG